VIAKGANSSSAADSIVLQWLMIQCLPANPSPAVKAAAAIWMKNFKQNYPNGLRDVNGRLFKPDHPLVLFAPPP